MRRVGKLPQPKSSCSALHPADTRRGQETAPQLLLTSYNTKEVRREMFLFRLSTVVEDHLRHFGAPMRPGGQTASTENFLLPLYTPPTHGAVAKPRRNSCTARIPSDRIHVPKPCQFIPHVFSTHRTLFAAHRFFSSLFTVHCSLS